MRYSIATVSLGGTLREKLEAISAAGFEGVEIFEADILAHDRIPADVGAMVRDLGMEIVALQPFHDFEGMPEPRRSRGFERARRKFHLMNELGTKNILVCSNVSPQSLGGIDRVANDLTELGNLANGSGVNVGFEALAWGQHISDYRDAWEAVRRADHPRVGLILDSYHILARDLPVDPIRSIPADRIAFVQVADAPRTPRQIASDGERSLIYMTGLVRGGTPMPDPTPTEGLAFIEFSVSEEDADELSGVFRAMGFAHTGHHRSKDVDWWRQGNIDLVINTETDGFAHSHYITHGPSVAAIGLWVGDASQQMDRAEAFLATAFRQPVGPGELEIPAIRGVSGSLIYFLDHGVELGKVWEVEFDRLADKPRSAGLNRIDHIAQTIPFEELPSWRLFYLSIFDFDKTPQVDVADPAGLVESEVMQSPGRTVQIALNSSQARQTQSSRFINEFFGAGVQHIAFATDDIFAAVEQMRAAGLDLLPIPENYYDDLEARFDLDAELADRLRTLNILYDEDENRRYFQVYTRVFADRFFFEFVSRDGYQGFGAANAPIRLAAQARLSRHPAVPRR